MILYSKKDCPQCSATKKWLVRNGLEFQEIDIEENKQALEYLISRGYKQAPVIELDHNSWSGFQPDKLNNLLLTLA